MSGTLTALKALAGETRLKILRALSKQDMNVELIAERAQLTPTMVSFHMKKLLAAGLVDSRREQYYVVYSLRRSVFDMTLGELTLPRGESDTAGRLREEMYRRKVLRAFMPDGRCEVMPAQIKKRMIVYDEIYALFEPGRRYTEAEVNATISRIHDDYCTVRRAFIGLGWMSRENGIYTVLPRSEAVPDAR